MNQNSNIPSLCFQWKWISVLTEDWRVQSPPSNVKPFASSPVIILCYSFCNLFFVDQAFCCRWTKLSLAYCFFGTQKNNVSPSWFCNLIGCCRIGLNTVDEGNQGSSWWDWLISTLSHTGNESLGHTFQITYFVILWLKLKWSHELFSFKSSPRSSI